MRFFFRSFFLLLAVAFTSEAGTTITFTRSEVNEMSTLWETDCVSISPLPNAQYPTIAGTWDFIFPHTSISSDRDIHIDMAIDSSGTGSTGNNIGESPLIGEVINATSSQLSHLDSLTGQKTLLRGIFRFYTEHSSERHFELHPVTQLQTWNGSTFVADSDYHSNIVSVADGATHPTSTLIGLLDGSETVTAAVAFDNTNITFTFPSPSVNYVQYDGVTVSGIQSDALGQYFVFQPNLVPGATVRCRLVSNTAAATAAVALTANEAVTVNALTRTDMSAVSSQISSMSANEQKTFMRPVEFIVLNLSNIGPAIVTQSFTNSANLPMSGAPNSKGKGSPYPSVINVSGVAGTITNVTAQLHGLSHPYPTDLDILLVGPGAENVMLMSDVGGNHSISNVDLTFDESATVSLSSSKIVSGTYLPTNFNPRGDADAFPSPAPIKPYGNTLANFNGTSPNGTWSLFVLDEFTSGSGSISGGWTLNVTTHITPPPQVQSAVSRLTHGAAGTFDISLPLGNPGIECRAGNPSGSYQLLVTFVNPIAVNAVSLTTGIGNVSSWSVSGNVVTINLTGVTNAQRMVVTLIGASDGTNSSDVAIPMNVLVGDTNADGIVNSADISQTKSQSGNAVTASNFREDVTVDGFLNSGDISLVKSKSGTGLP